jgi:hypothetical protein
VAHVGGGQWGEQRSGVDSRETTMEAWMGKGGSNDLLLLDNAIERRDKDGWRGTHGCTWVLAGDRQQRLLAARRGESVTGRVAH